MDQGTAGGAGVGKVVKYDTKRGWVAERRELVVGAGEDGDGDGEEVEKGRRLRSSVTSWRPLRLGC